MLSGDDYTMMMKQAFFNPFQNENAANIRAFMYDENWSEYENYNNNTNWQDAITQHGFTQEHYLSLSGQSDKLGYQLSAGYNKGKGTMIYTSDEDYSIHLNLSYQLIKILTAKLLINYNNIKADSYNTYNDLDLYEGALKKMPNMSVYDSETDGTLTSEYYVPTKDVFVSDGNYSNPVHYASISYQDDKNKIFNPAFSLELTPIKRLKYTFIASKTDQQYDLELHDPVINYACSSSYSEIGTYKSNVCKTNTKYLINEINYILIQKKLHQLKLSATYSINNRKSKKHYEAFDYQGPYSSYANYNSEQKKQNITGGVNYFALNRYFINIGVYTQKYKSTYSGNGYALNAKWIISNETFLKHPGFLDHLSITVSNRNQNIPISNDYSEKQHDLCFGSHLQIWKRFSFNASYYKRKLKDQYLFSYFNIKQSVLDKGWEFITNIAIIDQAYLKLNVFANLYKNTRQITETNYDYNLDFDYSNGSYYKHISLNEEYGKIYGFKYKGVYQYNDYIPGVQENAPVARNANGNVMYDTDGHLLPMLFAKSRSVEYQFQGGDAIYQDINYDGNIDENDIQQIGNTQPKITGTAGTSLQYKNWWLGIFFNYRYGNDIVNLARMDLENMYTYDNQTTAVNNRWRKDGDQTDVPRALYNYGYNWLGSTRFVEDGSFFRLKAITLKYEMSENIISKLHLNGLSFYITGKNLFTKTNYQGADPDISLNTTWDNYGYDDNYKAAIRQWIFGINVSI
jgi:hypothetical protein